MKKLLVLLLIIFVSIFSAVAVDVTGRGIGSTEDEALRMAREDLISQFSINVSSLYILYSNLNQESSKDFDKSLSKIAAFKSFKFSGQSFGHPLIEALLEHETNPKLIPKKIKNFFIFITT